MPNWREELVEASKTKAEREEEERARHKKRVEEALTTAEANAIIQDLKVYRDDGSGAYEGGSDTLVTTVGTLALDGNGDQIVTFTDNDANVQLPHVTGTLTYFVVLYLTATYPTVPGDMPLGDGTSLRLLICNTPPDVAELIAKELVSSKLAAGVNILPGVISLYWWKGELCRSAESTLLIRTTQTHVEEVTQTIFRLHPYEVPELSSVELLPGEGSQAFAEWIRASVK